LKSHHAFSIGLVVSVQASHTSDWWQTERRTDGRTSSSLKAPSPTNYVGQGLLTSYTVYHRRVMRYACQNSGYR